VSFALGQLSRRRFLGLTAGAGLGVAVSACGGNGGSSGGAVLEVEGDLQLVRRFPSTGLVPEPVRLPVSLADSTGILGNDGSSSLPDELVATVTDSNGATIADGLVAVRRGDSQSVPYWAFVVDTPDTGVYSLRLNAASTAEVAFQVDDPADVAAPVPGNVLPPFDTPTFDNGRGVDPVCSRAGEPCPFHSITLTDALAASKPVAYLIGTPAFCKTGTCAPGLEDLITVAKEFGDAVNFVHADVYADSQGEALAPAVRAYKLDFEPVLYVTNSDGTITTRLDAVFEAAEIRDALSRVVAQEK
jgi:hypothetical protein